MPLLPPEAFAALEAGALLLTPTALSASAWRDLHDTRAGRSDSAIWEPANVLSWTQWMRSLWTGLTVHGHETRLLLSSVQEEALWREIIRPSLEETRKSSVAAFAKLARSAFARALTYRVLHVGNGSASHSEDHEEFVRWAAQFQRLCGRHGYLPAAQLAVALQKHLERGVLLPPRELHLSGFTEWTPADAALLETLRRAGTEVVEYRTPRASSQAHLLVRATTSTQELRAAACWLRKLLDEHLATAAADDLPRVHVVLGNPDPSRSEVELAFREFLAPELSCIGTGTGAAPWGFADGTPLREEAVASTLVRLLRGLLHPVPVAEVTALLLSPYLGAEGADRDVAAQFDAWALRSHLPLRPEFSLPELLRRAQSSPFGVPVVAWLQPFLEYVNAAGSLDRHQTYAEWTTFMRHAAHAAGWPGAQPRTMPELAAIEAWETLLDSVATLDFSGRRVTFAEALASVGQQLDDAVVNRPGQPLVRIVAAAEAAAFPADVLLLLGADESNWPAPVHAHPLLPWSLQASAAMPGANVEMDTARSTRLSAALLATPKQTFISFAAERDGVPQRLAPTLVQRAASEQWPSVDARGLLPADTPEFACETVLDEAPLPPLPTPHVTGGAAVLQAQAACGFQAFATVRLRSSAPRSATLGLDAGRAGSILHRALDVFWDRVRSQADLLALSGAELDAHLEHAVREGFAGVSAFDHLTAPWDRAYRKLQMERLFSLLREWLTVEAARSPFTVEKREQERQLTVGPLELTLRVDRVDSVNSGAGTVLIDYKTGANARPAAWGTERPDEPQLPLYTLLPGSAELRGVAFARVRRGELGFAGLQAEPGLLGKAAQEADFAGMVDAWRTTLTELAERFAAGDISVRPKAYTKTCLYCDQRLLCRVDPVLLQTLEGDTFLDEDDSAEEAAYD